MPAAPRRLAHRASVRRNLLYSLCVLRCAGCTIALGPAGAPAYAAPTTQSCISSGAAPDVRARCVRPARLILVSASTRSDSLLTARQRVRRHGGVRLVPVLRPPRCAHRRPARRRAHNLLSLCCSAVARCRSRGRGSAAAGARKGARQARRAPRAQACAPGAALTRATA